MFMSHGPTCASKYAAIFCNYDAADEFLGEKTEHQFGKQAGGLDRLHDGSIGLRYHSTHVVTLHEDLSTTFSTGGWYTMSTQAWMSANSRFRVSLYEPRSGVRKPFRYSTIRFAGRDRNIERKLREEMNLPTPEQVSYISKYAFVEYVSGSGDSYEQVITNPEAHAKVEEFQAELARRLPPTYVYEDGITFTWRGRCTSGATLLSDAMAKEKKERDERNAANRKIRGQITRFVNVTMKALATGLPVEQSFNGDVSSEAVEKGEPNSHLLMRAVSNLPGDTTAWLNFQRRGEELVIGELPPVVEPIIRRRLREHLTLSLIG